jgi:hypothetical protein
MKVDCEEAGILAGLGSKTAHRFKARRHELSPVRYVRNVQREAPVDSQTRFFAKFGAITGIDAGRDGSLLQRSKPYAPITS